MNTIGLKKFHSPGRWLVTWLVITGIALPSGVYAQAPHTPSAPWYSRLPGLDYLTSRWNGEASDPEVKLLIDQKIREAEAVPSDIRALRDRTLNSYFPGGLPDDGRLPAAQLELLVSDARRLAEYYEADNNDLEVKAIADSRLVAFINRLTPKKLRARIRNESITEPIGDWTTESLVVREKLVSLARFQDRAMRALSLLTGSHLKGATKKAYRLVLFSAFMYVLYDTGILSTIGVQVGRAFTSGPLAAIATALVACIMVPTNDLINIMNLRYTGGISTYLNNLVDKFRSQEETAGGVEANTQVKTALVEEDETNLGGQSRENQIANWTRMLGLVVRVKNRFYKLARDIHHGGRGLLMNPLIEEQFAATFVETLDGKMVSLNIQAMQLLTPYQTRLLIRDQDEQKDMLDSKFFEYEELCSRTWLKLMDEVELADLKQKIDKVRGEMIRLGVPATIMAALWDIQIARAKVAESLTTGLSVNELRLTLVPENNRNGEIEARLGQRTVRRGFGLQGYTNLYLDLIAAKHRQMGWENDGVHSNVKCETLLEKIAQ